MANRIAGITVEIGGDTTKLNKALETVNGTIKGTQNQLKDVEKLLKLDPTNTELLAQKQSLLTQAVEGTSEKLDVLKTAAQQAQSQLDQGKITQEQFNALQREIAETSSAMQQYNGKLSESNSASSKLKTTISQQESELSSLKKQYTDVVMEQGKDSDAAKDLQSKYDQLNSELTDNKNKMSAAESAASALGKANQSARTPLETLKNTVATQETAIAKMSEQYQNACIQYGKNSTQAQNLAGKIKLLSSEHQDSKNQLSAMENETKKLTSAEQGLTDKLSSQKQDLSKLKQEYVDATAKYGKHSSEAKSLEQQIKTLSGEISSEEKTVQKASEAADEFDKSMKNAGGSAKTAGEKAAASEGGFSKLAGTLGKGVATVAKAAVGAFEAYTGAAAALGATVAATSLTTFSQFESQMSTVKALMSGSCETVEELNAATAQLSEKAKELGSTTSFTSTEVGEAMEFMAMAGWNTNDIMTSVSGVINLAAASGEDLATVSDIVTDSMTALGIAADGEFAPGVSNASHYADVLAATATSANTNVSLLGESFKYCAPIAGTLGASAEDLSIALGLMANSGIKGSQAGNSLKNALVNMSKPTDAQAAAMENLGIEITNADGSYKSLQDIMDTLRSTMGAVNVDLVDSEGNMRDYDAIMADLSATTEGLTQAEQLQNAATIFGKQNLAGMLAIINATDEDYQSLTESIYGFSGAAEEMAQIKLDNLKGDLTLLSSAAEVAALSIGEKLAPSARTAVQGLTDIVSAFNEGGLSAALSKIRELVTQLAETLKTQIPQILPGLLDAFNSILMTIIQSIGTLLPTLIDTLLPTLVTEFLNLITQLASYISTALPAILESIFSALLQIGDAIMQSAPTILNSVMTILQELISFISSNLPQFISVALTLISGFAVGILDALPDVINAALQLTQGLINGIIDNLPMKAVEKLLQLDWNVNGLGNVPKANSVVNNYYNNDNSRTVNQTNNSPKSLHGWRFIGR